MQNTSTYFMEPSRVLKPPICPTPPNNCINCCCDILFSIYCKSLPSLPPRLDDKLFTDGGLFMTSLIRRHHSSSFSNFGSCIQKNNLREVDLNFSKNTRPVLHCSTRLNSQSSGKTIKSSSARLELRSFQQK